MSEVLTRWNFIPIAEATNEILPRCGSRAWAKEMAKRDLSPPRKDCSWRQTMFGGA